MALTEKQKNFAREYFSNGGNATQAYLTTYDSKNEQVAANEGSLLLKNKEIQEYIATMNKPLEQLAISEREKKRTVLWNIINSEDASYNDICRAMDILNKMDSEYITINRNIEDRPAEIKELDTNTLRRLSEVV